MYQFSRASIVWNIGKEALDSRARKGWETYLLDTISIRDNPNSRETFLLTLFYIIYYKHYFFFFICRIIMRSKIEKKILDKMESR